jgi:dihydrofolate synthase/folylpolyglutamate synthase
MTPIGLDHMQYLGDTIEKIAKTKSGIFKPESNVVLSAQEPEAAKVLLQKVAQVSAIPFREGMEFSLLERNRAVGGQLLKIAGIHREYEDLFLPLYGDHQAHNATVALAAAEAFAGVALDEELVRNAFAKASSPGRFEIIKRNPTVIVDAAHNPHGMSALMKTLNSEFDFQRVIGVIGVMADKDVAGLIDEAKKGLDLFIASQNSSTRAMPTAQLAAIAGEFIPDKSLVIAESDLKHAIQSAIQQATDIENTSDSNAAVLITGSVVTAGEAKTILREIYGDRK